MKRIRRIIAAVLIAVLTYSILGSSLYGVYAADSITLTVDSFTNKTLTFHWSQLTGAKTAVVAYHKPDLSSTTGPAIQVTATVPTGSSISIPGLEADYVYDIRVTVYGATNPDGSPSGSPIGEGLLFYLPSITFTSTAVSQEPEKVEGGGLEVGSKPKLKLSWKIPRVYYSGTDVPGDNNQFILATKAHAKKYMEDQLNAVYGDGRELSTLNFKINISTALGSINNGPTHATVLVDQQTDGGYQASVSQSSTTPAAVTIDETKSLASFELWGRADAASTVPTTAAINVLAHDGIFPGTVYYMNIKPIYRDSAKEDIQKTTITVGVPSESQNGSMLSGERAYTNTPIRFQLTKDSANNIYVKIYKINQGSLDLPRLYYQIQATDDPSIPGDWSVKKTLDDSYFSGATAVTVLAGVNPNNKVYYKIVVKSDSAVDRLESLPLPYTLTVDTSRPPLPIGLALEKRVLDVKQATVTSGTSISVKSTDVTISWDKPLNWDTAKNDLYFHFLLNTNQSELSKDVPLYVDNGTGPAIKLGDFNPEYRLVKYVSATSSAIKVEGNRLSYTINAFELFKGVNGDGTTEAISNPDNYPTFLLPNTAYYLQMYTTKVDDRGQSDKSKWSDRSVILSFTTLNGVERDVPLPMSFMLNANGKTAVAPILNYIELKFDKVSNLDWNNYVDDYDERNYKYYTYYDIYMNSRTNTEFLKVGSTQDTGDVGFTGHDDAQSTSIIAKISEFTTKSAIDVINRFGHNLQPNTTYYFKVRTRLVQVTSQGGIIVKEKESIDTAILPVTTIVLQVTPPDDSQRKPLAPTDFSIALDSSQQPLVSGNSVTFSWKRQEDDVIYQLIRTKLKVSPTDSAASYGSDPEYLSFLKEYDVLSDGSDNDKVYLDPAPPSGHTTQAGFSYDPVTDICTYTVDRVMYPNKLYYFSLKAIRVNAQRVPLSATTGGEPSSTSVWVSIPVTTSLIDAPASLEAVIAAELGFFWTDATSGLTAEDYSIYTKTSAESEYKLMNRSRATIVKDSDGRTYYGRITGLKVNTYYDIKVTKGSGTLVYEKTGMVTRDGYHELEIKWKGKTLDSYSRYDIAIMAEGGSEYTVLSSGDLEQYADKNGSVLPYYTEEVPQTVNSEALYYHARIKTMEVRLAGGIVTHQPLRSNVKYYIKVRAVKTDPVETDLISYSKYIGPVNVRTEFNQDDYDNTDREEQQKAVFLDRMEELEKGYYWRVSISDGTASRILLKGDRVSDAMKNSSGDTFTVDMTKLSININKDEIYVPVSVLKTMNSLSRNLAIRTASAELLLRPTTLDASANDQIKEVLERSDVKDLYMRLTIARSTTSSTPLPSSLARASDINELDIQAWGLSTTDSDLKQRFHDKLYDKDSGLVTEKLNMLQNSYVGTGTAASKLIDQYTQSLVEMIEKELSTYINTTLESVKLSNAVRDITTFGAPASANLAATGSKGVKQPYILYDDSAAWQKISSATVSGSYVRFNLVKTGKYVILTAQTVVNDVPSGYWAESYISKLTSKYDLSDVFTGINNGFMPENKATCTEVVLLYEKVTGKTAEDSGLDIRQKTAKLGLDGIISANALAKNVKRQETAAVLLKLFAVKKGVNAASLKPGGNIDIADESSIGDAYYSPVVLVVSMDIMSLDANGKFYPLNQMTRAELAAAFVRLLEKAGE